MSSAYVLECRRPIPIAEGENPNIAFLSACSAALGGEPVWRRKYISALVPLVFHLPKHHYTYEAVTNGDGIVNVSMRPYHDEAKGWVALRRGSEVVETVGTYRSVLSASDARREKRFYIIEGEEGKLSIRAIICCSTL